MSRWPKMVQKTADPGRAKGRNGAKDRNLLNLDYSQRIVRCSAQKSDRRSKKQDGSFKNMAEIPWDAPATAWLWARGINRERGDYVAATLRETIDFVLARTNGSTDGYIVRLEDRTRQWAGAELVTLGHVLPGE
jgi:hypothetical protein